MRKFLLQFSSTLFIIKYQSIFFMCGLRYIVWVFIGQYKTRHVYLHETVKIVNFSIVRCEVPWKNRFLHRKT